jgi:hypothetical protein
MNKNSKTQLIRDSIQFMKSMSQHFGAEEGMRLWNSIAETLGSELKQEIFFSLLTGQSGPSIKLECQQGQHSIVDQQRVPLVKLIRSHAGCDLKTGIDLMRKLSSGEPVDVIVDPHRRQAAMEDFRSFGLLAS